MPRVKKWTKYEDINDYVKALEDVYGIDVRMEFKPKAGKEGENFSTVVIMANWKGDAHADGPLCYWEGTVKRVPVASFISSMTYALTMFTNEVLNTYIEAYGEPFSPRKP